MIDEILDLSKVEAGKIQLEDVTFDLNRRISDTTHAFNSMAQEKGILLTTCLDEKLPTSVQGDPFRLDQMLSNLISNAVKFTTAGEVRVSAAPVDLEKNDLGVRIEVSDTGAGIPAEKLETIFEAFNQGDASTTRRYGGTGLGLTIVSRLVDLMGGAIEVQSSVGKGSTFRLTIPFRASLEKMASSPLNGIGQPIQTSLTGHILLVDDNRVNLMVARRMLVHLGHECVVAGDGREAIGVFEDQAFDLILMDIQMPEMNGFQTTMAIREIERESERAPTPIVALTAHTMKGDRERCLAAGMSGFLAKPITLQALAQTIAEQMQKRLDAAGQPKRATCRPRL